jgi:hypothetical protein
MTWFRYKQLQNLYSMEIVQKTRTWALRLGTTIYQPNVKTHDHERIVTSNAWQLRGYGYGYWTSPRLTA